MAPCITFDMYNEIIFLEDESAPHKPCNVATPPVSQGAIGDAVTPQLTIGHRRIKQPGYVIQPRPTVGWTIAKGLPLSPRRKLVYA